VTPFPNDIYERLTSLERAVRLLQDKGPESRRTFVYAEAPLSCDEREERARRARVVKRVCDAALAAGRRIATDLDSKSIYSPL
jgi:hypothetical protein